MPWQLSILAHSLLSGLRATQNRRIGLHKKDLSSYALVVSFTCVFIVGLAVSLFDAKPVDHVSGWDARYYALLGGLLFGTQNLLTLHLFRIVTASVAVLLTLMNPLSVVIIASVVGGESLTVRQVAGSVILLASVLLVKLFSHKPNSETVKKNIALGISMSFFIALLYGAGVVNEKYLLDRISIETYVVYGWGAQFLVALAIGVLFRNNSYKTHSVKIHANVWLYGLLLAVSGLFFIMTLVNSDSSSLTSVSASSKVITAMIFAYLFLKERSYIKLKAFAVLLSGVGLYLLFS